MGVSGPRNGPNREDQQGGRRKKPEGREIENLDRPQHTYEENLLFALLEHSDSQTVSCRACGRVRAKRTQQLSVCAHVKDSATITIGG